MRNLTLNEAKSVIARVLGVCDTSAKVKDYLNEAQERLLNRSLDPVGSWMRYRVCLGSDNCLVWPRQVRTIKAFWVCNVPGIVRSEWFETIGWNEGGIGLAESDDMPGKMLIDHGTSPAFDTVIATDADPKKIEVVADNAADAGKTITLRYYDANGNRVYTSIGGTVQEGEQLTLVAPPGSVKTANNVMTNGLYHVVKDTTDFPIRLYEVDGSDTRIKQLATYEPSEETPIYRRTLLPGLTDMAACEDATSDCNKDKAVTILAKLQHIPVVVDNDPLVIGNLPALKDMVQSILMRERHQYNAARSLEANANKELDGEIASYLGEGMVHQLKMQDMELWGAGGIVNAI